MSHCETLGFRFLRTEGDARDGSKTPKAWMCVALVNQPHMGDLYIIYIQRLKGTEQFEF